jgi:hypothetical protein
MLIAFTGLFSRSQVVWVILRGRRYFYYNITCCNVFTQCICVCVYACMYVELFSMQGETYSEGWKQPYSFHITSSSPCIGPAIPPTLKWIDSRAAYVCRPKVVFIHQLFASKTKFHEHNNLVRTLWLQIHRMWTCHMSLFHSNHSNHSFQTLNTMGCLLMLLYVLLKPRARVY